jgi:hypothetical protein
MFDSILEENQIHSVASNHIVVLGQEHVKTILGIVKRLNGLVDFRQFHVDFFRLITCRFGSVPHKIDKVLSLLDEFDEFIAQVFCDMLDKFFLEPILVRLNGKSIGGKI